MGSMLPLLQTRLEQLLRKSHLHRSPGLLSDFNKQVYLFSLVAQAVILTNLQT